MFGFDPRHGFDLGPDLGVEQVDEAQGARVDRAVEEPIVCDLCLPGAQNPVNACLVEVNHRLNLEERILKDARVALIWATRLTESSNDADGLAESV